MATVLNRTTKQVIVSANTPDYPVEEWIHEPDLSAVARVPSVYWQITGDKVTEMSSEEKAAVDAAIASSRREAAASQLEQQEDILRATLLLLLDDRNALAGKINGIKAAVVNGATLAAIKTAVTAIADAPTYTELQLRTAIKSKLGT